jgi:hypothetical protein
VIPGNYVQIDHGIPLPHGGDCCTTCGRLAYLVPATLAVKCCGCGERPSACMCPDCRVYA